MAKRLRELNWPRATTDRRFKEALEAPFWTTLHRLITGRLWRALAHPSPFLALPINALLCSEAQLSALHALPVF
jgi:hypothetical protein